MTRLSSRLSLALALGAVGLWSVSSAVAATQTVTLKSTKGDQATITLNQKTKKAFKKNHIALKTNKPATRKGNNANFPEKSGKWNFSNTSGNVTYNGVTRFVRGKRSVKLTKLSFTRTVKGKKSTATLTAFFGKKKVTLLTLTGKVKVKMKGAKETVSGFTAKLSKKAASRLNSGLKHKAFKANQKIGSFSVTLTSRATLVTNAPAPGAPGTPGASASGVAVAFTPAFESALGSSGLSVTPLGPASNTVLGGLSGVTLPIGNGSDVTVPGIGGAPAASAGFNDGTLSASVPLAGGVQLSNGDASVTLTNPVLSIGTGTDGSSGLYFSLNGGPEIKLFDIDTATLEAAALPGGVLDLNGLLTELSSELSGTLNELAGQQIVQPGQAVGLLSAILPSSAAVPGS
ncbi:MAG TPA: hypothetical protein VHW96_02935 [Solirubrobacteraceae bacterium]|jgi:hypothetical protein|nr:hypothetical protein [Solirubrobacteraceae bacterium]